MHTVKMEAYEGKNAKPGQQQYVVIYDGEPILRSLLLAQALAACNSLNGGGVLSTEGLESVIGGEQKEKLVVEAGDIKRAEELQPEEKEADEETKQEDAEAAALKGHREEIAPSPKGKGGEEGSDEEGEHKTRRRASR